MKRVRLLFAAFVAATMYANTGAETRVGGPLHGDNRWDAEGSPYVVESDLVVTRFAHLTVDPGVRVVIAAGPGRGETVNQFDALDSQSISIKVEGALMCVGKKNRRITFVPAGGEEGKLGWYGIIFNKANGKFCEIAFADITGAYNGVLVYECKPLVRNSVFERNNIGVSCLKNGGALVFNCIVANNFAAGIRVQEANPHVANSIVMNNRNNGLWCDGISKVRFECNCVWGNSDGNFLDCDPLLGRMVRPNKNKDSVDHAGNLCRDPVFFGTPADSVAFARDIMLPTDKSKVKNVKLAKVVNTRMRDSSFTRYKSQKRPRYFLSRYSPCINAGSPGAMFKDADGSRNDIGIYGGPDFMARGKEQ